MTHLAAAVPTRHRWSTRRVVGVAGLTSALTAADAPGAYAATVTGHAASVHSSAEAGTTPPPWPRRPHLGPATALPLALPAPLESTPASGTGTTTSMP